MSRLPAPGRWLWAGIILGWWTLNGFATASQYHLMRHQAEMPVSWSYALVTSMTSAYLWIPITVFALWSASRFPFERGRWVRRLPIQIAATAGVILYRAFAVVALNGWIGWYTELPPFSSLLVTSLANNTFLYWLLVGVAHAVHYARAYRQREQDAERLRIELVQVELEALRARLQPHFLFNALNTISSMVSRQPEAAERMIARLSELLRHSLDREGAPEVMLRDELELVAAYLAIEEARFEDRLNVRWEVDPVTLGARVPPLLLQPLIENAVLHGIAPRSAPGTIEISATRADGALRLVVRDDGVGPPAGASSGGGNGVGLKSTRTRLERLYGERHGFHFGPAPAGGTIVEISLPFNTDPT